MSRMSDKRSGEPLLASFVSWAVLAGSFGLSASTWVALAVLAGFTGKATVHGVTVDLAWLMPVTMDGYVVVALVLWMAPVPAAVARFAKGNTYLAASIAVVAQSAYHTLLVWSQTGTLWRAVLALIVGALPPAAAGGAVHMRALIRRESGNTSTTNPSTTTNPVPTSSGEPALSGLRRHITGLAATTTDMVVPNRPLSTIDPGHPASPVPTSTPEPAPAAPAVPSPADLAALAARVTKPAIPTAPAAAPGTPAPATRARTSRPATPAPELAPSTTDFSVSASDAAQLALPIVSPDLLARAREVARQYRTEHGTPITANQMAVRLKVTTEQASQALAVLDLDPDSPTKPIPTVNGTPAKATR